MASELDLQRVHDAFVAVAREAGAMILAANPQDIAPGTKINSVDLVTETDRGVEAMVTERLLAEFPDVSFMGEETFKPGVKLGPEPTFIVDPIDGTTNFVHTFPNACISLGLAIDRKPVVGVIYNPYHDLLYTGIKGRGSFLRRAGGEPRRLPLSGNPPPLNGLGTSLVVIEWPAARDGPNFDVRIDTFRKLSASRETGGAMVQGLRALGSAALSFCALAAGQVDMYWEGGCWAWDVCAGWCILAEAGGIVVDGNPGDWEPTIDRRTYLAVRGAPSGQREIVEEFWAVVGDGRMEYES